MNRDRAVSDTHLDVYKRQPVRGGYAAVWIKANPQDFSGDTETAEIHIRLADTPVERKCVKIDVVKSDIVMG